MLRNASIPSFVRPYWFLGASLLTLTASCLLVSGCGMGTNLAGQAEESRGVALGGNVHGGQQPVTGATITLYAAGSTGYGSAPSVLDTTTTDGGGNFSLTGQYNCPASPNDQVYLVATGGNSGTGSNSNLALMAGLGSCSLLQANAANEFIFMNEVTTVASVYALSQFMTASPNVGASASNYQGLVNAFATINNLTNISTGTALSVTPAYASNAAPYLNTSTVPQARINTLADIIAACINSNGTGGSSSACATLFTAATPSGGSAPTDTVQAMLNIAQNPGLNVSTLFGIVPPSPPFQPILASAPNDWTMPVTFTGGGLGVLNGTNGTQGFVQNYGLDIDTVGNVYVAGYDSTSNLPLIAEFNNQGAPQTPATTEDTSSPPVISFGGYQELLETGGTLPGIFDRSGNLWVGEAIMATSPTLSETNEGALGTASISTLAFDPAGDIWLGESNEFFDQFDSSFDLLNQYTDPSPSNPNTTEAMSFDSGGNLYSIYNRPSPTNLYVYTGGSLVATFSSATASALAGDDVTNMYACNASMDGINVYNVNVNTAGAIASYSLPLGCNTGPLVDGLGNIWAFGSTTGAGWLQELNSSGTSLSPATGYTGASSSEPNPMFNLVGPYGQAIDGSGNLWTLNAASAQNGGSPGNVVVEFVGLAAPVVTPHTVALHSGQLATRP